MPRKPERWLTRKEYCFEFQRGKVWLWAAIRCGLPERKREPTDAFKMIPVREARRWMLSTGLGNATVRFLIQFPQPKIDSSQ